MERKSIFEVSFKVLTIIGLVVLIALQFRSKDSIVYVDSIKLMNGYNGMKDARKAYEAKTSIWKSNLDSLKTELEGKIQDYQTKQAKLSEKEKQLTEELLQAKQQEFLNYQQVVTEKIQKEDQELTTKVVSKVNEYIKKYGEDHNYEIIMAATQYGNIVYSEKGKDITEPVLAGLNKEYTN
ncbi:MAG TPA: OmpH family outer membrane protein [Cyclobacteriaceae bacterium]